MLKFIYKNEKRPNFPLLLIHIFMNNVRFFPLTNRVPDKSLTRFTYVEPRTVNKRNNLYTRYFFFFYET